MWGKGCLWCLVLLICAVWVGLRIGGDTNVIDTDATAIFELERGGSLQAQATGHLLKQNKGLLRFAVGHESRPAAREAAQSLADGLKGLSSVRWVDSPLDRAVRFKPLRDNYLEHAGALLATEEVTMLAGGMGGRLFQRALQGYFGPAGRISAAQVRQDPFMLTDAYLDFLVQKTGRRTSSRYLDGKYFVLVTAGLKANAGNSDGDTMLASINQLIMQVGREFPAATLYKAGAAFFSEAQSESARVEVQTIVSIASVAIVLLTLLVFRSVVPLGGVFLVVFSGLLTGTAMALALFGEVHLFAVVFGTSLIGVVVDYGYHYFAYAGSATPQSFRRGLTLGMLTSVLGFLCLGFSPMAVLGQIAVYSAAGLIGAYLTVLLLLPVILPNNRRRMSWHTGTLANLAAKHGRFIARPSRRLFGLVGIAAVVGLGSASFNPVDDVRTLGRADAVLAKQAKVIAKLSQGGEGGTWLAVEGDSLQQALSREERMKEVLSEKFVGIAILGLSDFLPSLDRQWNNAALVQSALIEPFGQRLGDAIGVPVGREATAFVPMTYDSIRNDLPHQVLNLVMQSADGKHRHLMRLRGTSDVAALKGVLDAYDFAALVEPTKNLSSQLKEYRVAAYWALLVAVVLAAVLALWRYGWRRGATVFAVPAAATVLAFVLPPLVGANQNFFSAMALFLVFAICADYALFFAESKPADHGRTYLAVGLSAVSSCLAFGLLATSSIPLVRDIGLVVLFGVLCAWALAPMALSAGEAER